MRLSVMPGCVRGTLEQGWFRPKALTSSSHAIDDESDRPSGAAAGVQAERSNEKQARAIDAVLLELAQTAPLRRARLNVELADSLMHLDVVEGDFVGESDRQLHSIAVACVAELLGDAAQSHEIRWQLQADGKHLLIGAIAGDQLRVLSEAAARHGLTLGSVQPDFCMQWNRHSAALKPGSAVFAVASGREALIAHVSDGAVAAISSGTWLDHRDAPGASTTHVKHLMCGLGLESSVTAGVLDARVDRLLASVGLDAANQSAYVLVAPEVPDKAVSSRWTVLKEALTS